MWSPVDASKARPRGLYSDSSAQSLAEDASPTHLSSCSPMNYDEACESIVTREEARLEIDAHDVPGGFSQFLEDVGDRLTYTGQEVLDWLGY